MIRYLVLLLLALIATLWWRVAPWGSRGPMVGRPAGQRGERGGLLAVHQPSSRHRRSHVTMRLFKLRLSALARATSPACRSGAKRTNKPTTFADMRPVYICYPLATIIARCYDSIVLLLKGGSRVARTYCRQRRNGAFRSSPSVECSS